MVLKRLRLNEVSNDLCVTARHLKLSDDVDDTPSLSPLLSLNIIIGVQRLFGKYPNLSTLSIQTSRTQKNANQGWFVKRSLNNMVDQFESFV